MPRLAYRSPRHPLSMDGFCAMIDVFACHSFNTKSLEPAHMILVIYNIDLHTEKWGYGRHRKYMNAVDKLLVGSKPCRLAGQPSELMYVMSHVINLVLESDSADTV